MSTPSPKSGPGWQNAPVLDKLTASQQGGNRGAQLWGVQMNGTLNTIYQLTLAAVGAHGTALRGQDPTIRNRCMN